MYRDEQRARARVAHLVREVTSRGLDVHIVRSTSVADGVVWYVVCMEGKLSKMVGCGGCRDGTSGAKTVHARHGANEPVENCRLDFKTPYFSYYIYIPTCIYIYIYKVDKNDTGAAAATPRNNFNCLLVFPHLVSRSYTLSGV